MVKIAALSLLLFASLSGLRSAPLAKDDYRAALVCTEKEGGTYRLDSVDTSVDDCHTVRNRYGCE